MVAMRNWCSQILLPLLSVNAAIFLLAAAVPAQDGGTTGGNSLQGGVSALDQAQERQTMRLNLGSPAAGFIDNGKTLEASAHTERVPPEVFRAWLTDNHQRFALTTQTMSNGLVVDVAGRWDHADKTLDKFGIHYTHIKTGDITPEVLAGAKVVIINCAGEVRRDRLQYIRDFVQRGGYLLTTDWALNNMVEQTFPGYIDWNKDLNNRSIYTANYISPDAVLAKGCVRTAPWKLDAGAHLIGVRRPDLVRVLVTSPDLARDDHDHAGVLACLFPFGKGYVLHMLGHFDNNAAVVFGNFLPDPAPNIHISLRQALAANFVVAGLTGEPLATGRALPQQQFPSQQFTPQQFPSQSVLPQHYPSFQPQQQMPPPQLPPNQGSFLQVPQNQMTPQQVSPNQMTPQQVPQNQAPNSGTGAGHLETAPVTAPGAMPPLAPDRLHRQNH